MPEATYFPQVRVVDRGSPHDGETVDLLIEEGRIRVNPANVPDDVSTVRLEGLHVSPGWVDIGAALHEPGHEEKETVDSLLAAAQAGGYTHVVAFPETNPTVDDAIALRGVLGLVDPRHGVKLSLIGALSAGREGQQLAAAAELAEAGVQLIGDGLRAVEDPKLLQLALTYAQPFDLTVVTQPSERRLEGAGQMHEGEVSTALGLPGLPATAEEIGVARDLSLLDYRGGRLHFHALSLSSSVRSAASAKTQGAHLTYGVAALNLLATDEALRDYDATMKVLPPLRTGADRDALREAVTSGAADAIVSNHRPHDTESSRVEFPYAAFGAATLELTFAIAATAVGAVVAADYLGRRNRELAGVPAATIADGARAELSFFLPSKEVEVGSEPTRTAGVNVPLHGERLSGAPIATFVDAQWRPTPHFTSFVNA